MYGSHIVLQKDCNISFPYGDTYLFYSVLQYILVFQYIVTTLIGGMQGYFINLWVPILVLSWKLDPHFY